jgi:hypothetical protein
MQPVALAMPKAHPPEPNQAKSLAENDIDMKKRGVG